MELYYFNKTRLQKQSHDYYRNLSEERKEKKRQCTRNRCKNMPDEKKQKRIEYMQNHYKASKNSKLND